MRIYVVHTTAADNLEQVTSWSLVSLSKLATCYSYFTTLSSLYTWLDTWKSL